MRLFVLGATGDTGTQIVDLALARGHQVTAFVRSPHKIVRQSKALAVIKGDPLRADQLAPALRGHDAVLSALGPSVREAFRPHTLIAECAASTVAAMEMAGVNRLAIVSAAVLFPEKGFRFAFFRWLLQHVARDLETMETIVRATPFNWTIARPPRLVRSSEAKYRSASDALPPKSLVMSFRAVAGFLVDCVEQGTYAREIVGLGSAGHA